MNKTLLLKVLNALLYLISSFILGILMPFLLSCLIVLFSNTTFNDCIISPPFMIFSLLGIIGSFIYLGE